MRMPVTFFAGFTTSPNSFYFIPTINYEWGECGCRKLELSLGNLRAAIGFVCLAQLMEMETKNEQN